MLLEARNISYRYQDGPWLLRDFTITLAAGEVVGLVGPSGCGKTTLARIMAGYELPCEGSVSFNGSSLPVKGYNPIQLVFQHPEKAVNPRWRMEDILMEGGTPAEGVVKALGIEESWLKRWPNELSGGELQRFCLARVLNDNTKFIIADEISTMLDAITQAQIWQVVLQYVRNKNLGVLVVSHDRNLMKRLCDRVIELPIKIF